MELSSETKPSRRHSIAVALRRFSLSSSNPAPESASGPQGSGGRRSSIQDSLVQFSRNLRLGSVTGAGFGPGSELGRFLSKATLQAILANHFNDKKLKVAKMTVTHHSGPGVEDDTDGDEDPEQSSRSVIDPDDDVYEVEILFKTLGQRKRLDVNIRIIHSEEDEELCVYNSVIKDLRTFLSKNGHKSYVYIPIQTQVDCSKLQQLVEEDSEDASGIDNDLKRIFILESLASKGYKDDISESDGLDYEHSIMAISALARFHAASYCYRKQENIHLEEKYDFLDDPECPKISPFVKTKVQEVFQKNSQLSKHAETFLEAVKNGVSLKSDYLEHFRVLSHGNFIRENLQYSYRTELESRYFCSDLIFQNLSWAHTGSCVLDLLQFVFTSISPEIRQNFLADFVCSVYYDNFVKTVITLDQGLSIFRLKHFIREFEKNLMYGFLFSLEYKSRMLENEHNGKAEMETVYDGSEDTKLEEYILALANDIIQFKVNLKASILS